jgi:uncharacterized protein (DUF2141 family)
MKINKIAISVFFVLVSITILSCKKKNPTPQPQVVPIPEDSTSTNADTLSKLVINLSGMQNLNGKINVALYNSEASFNNPNQAYRELFLTPTATSMTIEIDSLPAGTYAFGIFHDENNNQQIDQNWLNIPTEGFAFSNNVIDSLVGAIQNLDINRIYVTGLSMGGYGTWEMLQRRPEFFAAAIPICGGGDKLQASKLTQIPIWAFHGTKDKAVPVIRTTDMYESIKSVTKLNPLRIKMTLYENKGHLIWNETYNNSEVIKWLLAQRIP